MQLGYLGEIFFSAFAEVQDRIRLGKEVMPNDTYNPEQPVASSFTGPQPICGKGMHLAYQRKPANTATTVPGSWVAEYLAVCVPNTSSDQ